MAVVYKIALPAVSLEITFDTLVWYIVYVQTLQVELSCWRLFPKLYCIHGLPKTLGTRSCI